MNKFGLIGNPIDTSSSPALFKAGYGGRYSYDLIEGPDFNISYGKFLDEYSGINVTAPFKLEAFSAADRKSDTCSRIGAANLIVKTGDGTMAFNTDFDGIILSVLEAVLHESGNEIYGRYSEGYGPAAEEVPGIYGRRPSALVAGCGGAGRAAAMAAATLGYDTVLMNRTPEKALEIAEDMPEYGFKTARIGEFTDYFRSSDLVIYTIPGKIRELEDIGPDSWGRSGKVILEANYRNPSFTSALIRDAAMHGCTYIPGKRWLLYQALTGFRIFTGETPDIGKMSEVL